MTGVGKTYGGALYALAREESLSKPIWEQMQVLDGCFRQNPDYLKLLSAPNLPRAERCRILDNCFLGKIDAYLLNFLKILTEKGYIRHFSACCDAYRELYYQDNGILPVTAVSAVPLSHRQLAFLANKLSRITLRRVRLENKLDPAVLGGIRLEYDGRRVDDTISHRLDTIRSRLIHGSDRQKAGTLWN